MPIASSNSFLPHVTKHPPLARHNTLTIQYSFADTPFGRILIASTPEGLCAINFVNQDDADALARLQARFPAACYQSSSSTLHAEALKAFHKQPSSGAGASKIALHLMGTPFQLSVWNSLLHVPFGQRVTYGDIARNIGNPKAVRAVGTAIGRNPIAVLIPCHRIIQSSGALGGYMWGTTTKAALLEWEQTP